ncbi:putative phage tail protein [Fusobacterium ulcerans]|uniref:putative phage tail protein n=1 Tax=Fusobacterium ulcerans TaxID=861 RepID=UPI002E76A8A1|nr:putative phage tail protein [Fusobacterium ulcerans]MEE0139723.1 putative phage tail protein [Fusobacterium ulcerans]
MIKYISNIARNSLMEDLFNSIEMQVDIGRKDISQYNTYTFIIDSTEETISRWEKFMELKPVDNYSLQDRIERVIYTIQAKGIFTPSFLKEQAKLFTNGEIEVIENFNDYHFIISFTSVIGIPPNMDNFKEMVDLNKPAHLTYEVRIRYRTWGELLPYTWGELSPFTWDEIHQKAEIE